MITVTFKFLPSFFRIFFASCDLFFTIPLLLDSSSSIFKVSSTKLKEDYNRIICSIECNQMACYFILPPHIDRSLVCTLLYKKKPAIVQKIKSLLYAKVVVNRNEMYLWHYCIRLTKFCRAMVLCPVSLSLLLITPSSSYYPSL